MLLTLRVAMNRLVFLTLLTGLTYAQSGNEPPPRENLPTASSATINLNDNDSARKARVLLNEAIDALGGNAYLTYQNRREEGRYYPLHHGQAEGTGTQYVYYVEYPDKDRFEVLKAKDIHIIPGSIDIGGVKSKKVDISVIHNGDKGYETTYKGTAAQDKVELERYLRRRRHSPEWVFRKWINDPAVALFYMSLKVVDSKPAEGISLLNANNDSVEVWFDQTTRYPIKISYSWRDPKDKQMNVEEEVYDQYKPEDGIMTPHSITRYFNGESSQQRFVSAAKYNLKLPDTFFEASVSYDPEAPPKKR